MFNFVFLRCLHLFESVLVFGTLFGFLGVFQLSWKFFWCCGTFLVLWKWSGFSASVLRFLEEVFCLLEVF